MDTDAAGTRIALLGPLAVTADGVPIPIGGVRLRALLARLALDAGRPVSVAELSDAVWDGDPPADPANAVQTLASRLRRALPDPSVLVFGAGGYRLDLPSDAVDALRFERLAAAGRRELRSGDPGAAARTLRAALSLWRGPALGDLAGSAYAAAPAARLDEVRLAALEDRIEADLALGSDGHLVAELEELTAAYPLREGPRRQLMLALRADGRTAEALAGYQRFRDRLADELGADPGPRLRDLHLAILRGEPVPDAGAEGIPARPRSGNLPAPVSSFIGREPDLDAVVAQLRSNRLVTLIGPGGAGKTRLAIAAGARLAHDMPGGVWLAELGGLTDPDQVPQAVVDVLGLREMAVPEAARSRRDPVTRLVEALSARETLLLLDNCEHLIDAVAILADHLLRRCPPVRVLATSREPLGLAGENLRPVRPLDLPPRDASIEQALAAPAVRLFADRAVAARPDFAVDPANVAVVVEVCRRLDGLPLAIELAAARLRSLPITHLSTHLDDRFRLLTGGSRTALPRHRTLRAVVAWSWDLLSDAERRAARRLAYFPSAIGADAAAAVCDLDPRSALDMLVALSDKSLLYLVGGSTPRYRMLETIREYGLESLSESDAGPGGSPEMTRVAAAHARHFSDVAVRAEASLRSAGQLEWISGLAAEHDNLLAALGQACGTGDADTAMRLAAPLGQLWTITGGHGECAAWLGRALRLAGADKSGYAGAVRSYFLLNSLLSGGRADPEPDALGGPVAPQAAAGHPAEALWEPLAALYRDDTTAGLAAVGRMLAHPDPWTRGMLWLIRAFLDGNDGDLGRMAADLSEAAAAFRLTGERWGLSTSLTYLGHARMTLGRFDSAVAVLDEAVTLQRQLNPADPAVMQRTWRAQARARCGDMARARSELLAILTLDETGRSPWDLVLARIALGDLARQAGDLDDAASRYQAAGADLGRLSFNAELFRAMLGAATAHMHLATGDVPAARPRLMEAWELAGRTPDMPLVAVISVAVARLVAAEGRADDAAAVLGAAHALRGAPDAFNPDVADVRRAIVKELGEPVFHNAYRRAARLPRGEAITLIESQLPFSREN